MSSQSDCLLTSDLQFGAEEHFSTIIYSTLLIVDCYVSNNSTDASKNILNYLSCFKLLLGKFLYNNACFLLSF